MKSVSLIFFTILIAVISNPAAGQIREFPQDFDYSYYSGVLLDAGYMWNVNSTFHPLKCPEPDGLWYQRIASTAYAGTADYLNRFASLNQDLTVGSEAGLSFLLMPGMGISYQTGDARQYEDIAFQPFFWSELNFRQRFYARVYFQATNEPESLPHFTGLGKNKERAGLSHGEIDQAILGFRNEWLNLEYGRSREIWGPMTEDNLLLAGNAPSYERIVAQFTYKRFACRWFYASLGAVEDETGVNINRYLAGRVIEYNNHHNLVLSAGEISVLAGPNRPPDWALLNPLAFHLDIEQNDRENDVQGNHSNAILFLNADWLLQPRLRLSGSIIIDDLQIDVRNREGGDADALGYSARIAYTPILNPVGLTLFVYGTRLDTYSLIHKYGYTNLVNRGEPIGSSLGNDADDYGVGFRLVPLKSAMIEASFSQKRRGEHSLLYDPYITYANFDKIPFPSGEVVKNQYISVRIQYYALKNLTLSAQGQIDVDTDDGGNSNGFWIFSARYQLPILITNL